MYVCMYMWVCMFLWACAHECTDAHACASYIYICMYKHTHTHTHAHAFAHTHTYIYIYICVCVRLCVCVCVCLRESVARKPDTGRYFNWVVGVLPVHRCQGLCGAIMDSFWLVLLFPVLNVFGGICLRSSMRILQNPL